MTQPVAEYLASKVFCILEDPEDDSLRVTANEFGAWSRDLPILLGDLPMLGFKGFKHSDRSTILYPESELEDAPTLIGASVDSDSASGKTYTSSYQTHKKGACW